MTATTLWYLLYMLSECLIRLAKRDVK